MAINSNQKGKRGERELAKLFRQHGFEGERGVQYCGRNGNADVIGVPGLYSECKWVEKLNYRKAIEQAVSDCKEDNIPAVFCKQSRKEWLALLQADEFLKIYKNHLKYLELKSG